MKGSTWSIGALAAAVLVAAPVTAQVRTVDPNSAIDADLSPQGTPAPRATPLPPAYQDVPADAYTPPSAASSAELPPPAASVATQAAETYKRDDVLAAAENTFGKGAEGLAGLVERLLREQGEPNAYIAGREAGGALVVGVRYGSGVMTHKVEGQRKVFWTGPSLGFDVGGDANKVFVLVYNLYDSQEIYRRFPAIEGRVFFVGGFAATYLRRGNTVLIPIRLGVGWRLGANVGYMNITEKSRWLPF
ncbi:hypothetical protein SAMN06297144_1465 [Sphingomonas guangdongensis]|uniref:DUF1134 domain-containing protein n=1 Tax=Sphingomonas guangdongensis TaxID=1141890 RepID=A0A285QHA9_9SPHN|nr:DUF1134 domain-containing protein [Sphingomonas guangdongensis]SOB81226.1 hypothetical protein SAMN06297144_1465 [Sphingomonas guangdongensis]